MGLVKYAQQLVAQNPVEVIEKRNRFLWTTLQNDFNDHYCPQKIHFAVVKNNNVNEFSGHDFFVNRTRNCVPEYHWKMEENMDRR